MKLVICDINGYVIVSVAWYTYTYSPLKAELIVHYDNHVHVSHVTFILHDQATHIPSSYIIPITMEQNSCYAAVFYRDSCSYEKSKFILHLHRNYISRPVYSLNIRQYVSITVLKRMRSPALS
jgi:hypothetical protein